MQGGIGIPKYLSSSLAILPLVLFWNSCESTDPTDWRSPEGGRFAKTSVEELYERAQRNDYFAMVHLGWRYDTGTGVKADVREAAAWYRQAAERGGHSMAQNNLGCLYRDGRGVIQDYKTASTLFRMSAEQGNNHARTNLGWLYERGYGVPQDYRQALQLYTKKLRRNIATSRPASNTLGIRWHRTI